MLGKSMQLNDTFCATMQAQTAIHLHVTDSKKTKIGRYKQQTVE